MHASCVRGAAPQCVYALDVAARSSVRIGLESDDFDGALVLLDKSGEPPPELACVDDTPRGDTHHARIDATLDPGRYQLVVDGVSADGGAFELFVQVDPLPPLSAVCAGADVLVAGQTFRGRTTGAPNQFSGSCAGGARGSDRVHAIDLQGPSRVRLRQQSEHDGALYVRQRCEDPSSEVACSDDFRDGTRSALALRLPEGRHYVFSDAFGPSHVGSYALSYERIDEPALRNVDDVCREARALAVVPGALELDTFTSPSVLEGSCGGAGAPEVALVVPVLRRSELRAEIEDPELNAILYVRERCGDGTSELMCVHGPRIDRSRGGAEAGSGALVIALDPGDYTLVVDGAEPGDMGAARLSLTLTPLRGR